MFLPINGVQQLGAFLLQLSRPTSRTRRTWIHPTAVHAPRQKIVTKQKECQRRQLCHNRRNSIGIQVGWYPAECSHGPRHRISELMGAAHVVLPADWMRVAWNGCLGLQGRLEAIATTSVLAPSSDALCS